MVAEKVIKPTAHLWQHDKTNKQSYVPKDCDGKFVSDPKGENTECLKCDMSKVAHTGIAFDDHSHCLLTCEKCGEETPCNKLYPQDRFCSGSPVNLHPVGEPEPDEKKDKEKKDKVESEDKK